MRRVPRLDACDQPVEELAPDRGAVLEETFERRCQPNKTYNFADVRAAGAFAFKTELPAIAA